MGNTLNINRIYLGRQELPVRIAFYMPFKPLDHPHPSGDLVIGTELHRFLRDRGHDIRLVSRLRARWIYWKPWLWAHLLLEMARARRMLQQFRPHVWLTYHAYYKAPDVLGTTCAPAAGIPYAIFQGVYATKYRRQWKTKPGFYLNRFSLKQASAVFTNKRRDQINLRRLVPDHRLHYIAPGIHVDHFRKDRTPLRPLRPEWRHDQRPVILTAAMFRPGVKADGVARVIRACGRLSEKGYRFRLVICGDGEKRKDLQQLAQKCLGENVFFTGRVPRNQMPDCYRQADLFVFPGIQEGLGMVYLEAQAAGLPVVACQGWGASEVVRHDATGLLCPPGDWEAFERHIRHLLVNDALRQRMGIAAQHHISRHHDLDRNYRSVETRLKKLAGQALPST